MHQEIGGPHMWVGKMKGLDVFFKKSANCAGKISICFFNWRFVIQPPALRPTDRQVTPLGIGQLSTIPSEIKLVAVAVKMLFADSIMNPDHLAIDESET